ncbi:ABC transporter ATP-binding protein [bacterium]|nr:ABC transporter ATP-binding protein [candidate division CSSED10-310 bacterium]
MTGYAVETENLTKRFGRFVAVDGVDLKVRRGEIYGFLGANGAGKTTTIRILCGLLRATSGKAVVNGIDVIRSPEKVKRTLGYMSQKFSLYEDLKVKHNLTFFGGVYRLNRRRLQSRIEQITASVGLAGLLERDVRGLPTGWKQRLALACAILHDPGIVFLDEPTGGVDPVSRRNFWDLIYSLADSGKTIFVTTHYMDEAEYCHRVAVMYGGRVLTSGPPGRIKEETGSVSLEEAFISLVTEQLSGQGGERPESVP